MIVERIQYGPRTAPSDLDMPDILIPALSRLRGCRDSIDVLTLLDKLPESLLPSLAWEASRRTYVQRFAVHTVVKYCGAEQLRSLGARKAAQLLQRYPLRKSVFDM